MTRRLFPLSLAAILIFCAETAQADTYYVSRAGSDSNACSDAAPCLTIAAGIRALSGGDTLIIRDGTYSETIFTHLPDQFIPVGAPGAHTTIKAENRGAVIWINDGSHAAELDINHDEAYITIDGIIFDGSNNLPLDTGNHGIVIGGDGVKPHDITLQYVESRNHSKSGFAGGGGSSNIIISNSHFHHNGTDCTGWALGPGHCHGIYASGFPNMIIEDSEFNHNEGFGIHLYSEPPMNNNVVVRNNLIHENGIGGAAGFRPTTGMILGGGTGIQAYDNVLWDNTGGGILVNYDAYDVTLFNNTVYDNGSAYPSSCILIGDTSVERITVMNNLCSQDSGVFAK